MTNLVFDRASTDVTYLNTLRTKVRNRIASTEEFDEWLKASLKGAYNYTDLNRVGEAVNYIANLLNTYGYANTVKAKTDWKMEDKPNPQQMNEYLANINKLREVFAVKKDTPNTPSSMVYLNWEKANDIEKILYDINLIIGYLEGYFIHSGVANLGQDRVWQQRFRRLRNWASQNYKLSQYADTDTVSFISSKEEPTMITIGSGLKLLQFTEFDKVNDTIATFNSNMVSLDSLIGYPVEYYALRNIIPDPSFENNQWNDTNNNSAYSTTEKAFGNRSLHFAVGTTIVANIVIERPILGHKYYGRRYIKTNGNNEPADARFEVYGGDGEGFNWVYAWNRGDYPEWGFDSAIYDINVINYPEDTRTIIRCFNVNTTADTFIDGLMLIDLTECFGAGKEPTKEWCDVNIPFFEGSTVITVRKEA